MQVKVKQRRGFAAVPNAFLRDGATRPIDRLVYTVLAGYTDEEHDCWPSLDTIVKQAGASKTTVSLSIARMATAGWIRVTKERRGRSTVNVYRLSMDLSEGWATVPEGTVTDGSTVPDGGVHGTGGAESTVPGGTGRRTNEEEPEEEEPRAASPPGPDPFTETRLKVRKLLQDAVDKANRVVNWGAEGRAVTAMVDFFAAQRDPENELQDFLTTYWTLTHNPRENLLYRQPFLPKVMWSEGLRPRVMDRIGQKTVDKVEEEIIQGLFR